MEINNSRLKFSLPASFKPVLLDPSIEMEKKNHHYLARQPPDKFLKEIEEIYGDCSEFKVQHLTLLYYRCLVQDVILKRVTERNQSLFGGSEFWNSLPPWERISLGMKGYK